MSGETRTTSSTGGQKGVKAERYDLIPWKGVAAIARVFDFGARKYADHNWRKRYEWSKSLASLHRHISAVTDGETYDRCPPDCEYLGENDFLTCRNHSGLPHLAHAGFHVLVLLTWLEEDGEGVDNPMDDRWPILMERARLEEERKTVTPLLDEQEFVDVGWRDPEPITVIAKSEVLRMLYGDFSFPARFIAGVSEITDAHHPVIGRAAKPVVEDQYGPDLLRKHAPFQHNSIAVRRAREYDDSYLREPSAFIQESLNPDS